jgi:hypothetical protein
MFPRNGFQHWRFFSFRAQVLSERRLPSDWIFSSQTLVHNWLGCPSCLLIPPGHGPRTQHRAFSYAYPFPRVCVYWTVPEQQPSILTNLESATYQLTSFRCLFRGRCPETNVSEPLPSSGSFSCVPVLALSKYATTFNQRQSIFNVLHGVISQKVELF